MMTHTCVLSVTGFESPGEWEDHPRIFGLDGPDIQYAVSKRYLYFLFSRLSNNLNFVFDGPHSLSWSRVLKMRIHLMYIIHQAMDMHSLNTTRIILTYTVL